MLMLYVLVICVGLVDRLHASFIYGKCIGYMYSV